MLRNLDKKDIEREFIKTSNWLLDEALRQWSKHYRDTRVPGWEEHCKWIAPNGHQLEVPDEQKTIPYFETDHFQIFEWRPPFVPMSSLFADTTLMNKPSPWIPKPLQLDIEKGPIAQGKHAKAWMGSIQLWETWMMCRLNPVPVSREMYLAYVFASLG